MKPTKETNMSKPKISLKVSKGALTFLADETRALEDGGKESYAETLDRLLAELEALRLTQPPKRGIC